MGQDGKKVYGFSPGHPGHQQVTHPLDLKELGQPDSLISPAKTEASWMMLHV